MAKPSNEELLAERREIAGILGTNDGEGNVAALRRVLAERQNAKPAAVGLDTAGNSLANPDHPSTVPDDDPSDRRPPFDPVMGWRTAEVLAWAHRRRAAIAKEVTNE